MKNHSMEKVPDSSSSKFTSLTRVQGQQLAGVETVCVKDDFCRVPERDKGRKREGGEGGKEGEREGRREKKRRTKEKRKKRREKGENRREGIG